MKCPIYEMYYLWNVLSMKCPIYERSYQWNVLSMKCLIYEMSYLWNVVTMNCRNLEMSVFKLSFNEMSQLPLYKIILFFCWEFSCLSTIWPKWETMVTAGIYSWSISKKECHVYWIPLYNTVLYILSIAACWYNV